MTKKEFIIAYNIGHRDGKLDEYLPNDYPEFIGQQPCEDCISRQAVLEYIEGSEAELGHSSENELVCQDIKELPSVTPTSDAEDKYDIGYNCGYADAMSDIAESEG